MLLLLIRRSLQRHWLVSSVAALALALGGALFLTARALEREARIAAEGGTAGFDAVVGARGSKLQLILCALFHIEPAPGLIPASDLEYLRSHPAVARAVPLAVGDNYLGYRLVGTTLDLFEPLPDGRGPDWRLAPTQPGEPEPRWFDPEQPEAVAGAVAARRLGLRPGARIEAYHGFTYQAELRHQGEILLTGVLEPTGTPMDRVIFIPLRNLQTLAGHDPSAANDLSAILVALKNPAVGFQLDLLYNRRGSRVTFAWPAAGILSELLDRFSWLDRLLGLLSILVGVSGTLTAVAVLHAGMAARRGDLVTLRSLGARRMTLAGLLLAEGAIIALAGAAGALALATGTACALASFLRRETGLLLEPWRWHSDFWQVPFILLVLGLLAALPPAWQAYRTDSAASSHG